MENDKLDELFELQTKLMNRYVEKGYIPEFPLDLKKKNSVAIIKDCMFHISSELHEAIKELKNRPDRKTNIEEYNIEEYEKELIDHLHLTIELLILSGYDSNKVVRQYRSVNKNNHERLDWGY